MFLQLVSWLKPNKPILEGRRRKPLLILEENKVTSKHVREKAESYGALPQRSFYSHFML